MNMSGIMPQSQQQVVKNVTLAVFSKSQNPQLVSVRPAACQCNGHSTCVNGSVCEQCRNLTTGPNCQTCMPGYHGDPTNGGKCQGEYVHT